MKIMRSIFERVNWRDLIPDSSILINHAGGNVAAHSKKGDWLIIYITDSVEILVNNRYLSLVQQSQPVWINPATGKTIKASFHILKNGILFMPTKWTDSVLLLKNKKK